MSILLRAHVMDTILVVEDDVLLRTVIERMLRLSAYNVLAAGDGRQAQSLLRSSAKRISAILLDWRMPEMSGIEFLHWIKKEPEFEHIPVIMETSMILPEHIKQGIDAGAFYYLTKPIEEKVMRSIVQAAVADLRQKETLLEKIRKGDKAFAQLVEGTFRFRTPEEGEFLAVSIANSSPDPEKTIFISELLSNAIEHGNLGITYDEKTTLIENDALGLEVRRRLALPEYAGKHVTLRLVRSKAGLRIVIKDEGKGFEFRKYLKLDETRVFHNHGRGIALTSEYLKLEYQGNGSEVVVTVPLK